MVLPILTNSYDIVVYYYRVKRRGSSCCRSVLEVWRTWLDSADHVVMYLDLSDHLVMCLDLSDHVVMWLDLSDHVRSLLSPCGWICVIMFGQGLKRKYYGLLTHVEETGMSK